MPPSPRVSEVAVTGCDRVSEAIVRGRIRSEPGARCSTRRPCSATLMGMYGIGEFEQVMFRLEPGADGGSRLAYEVREKNWGPLYLAYGVNLRSDFKMTPIGGCW